MRLEALHNVKTTKSSATGDISKEEEKDEERCILFIIFSDVLHSVLRTETYYH